MNPHSAMLESYLRAEGLREEIERAESVHRLLAQSVEALLGHRRQNALPPLRTTRCA